VWQTNCIKKRLYIINSIVSVYLFLKHLDIAVGADTENSKDKILRQANLKNLFLGFKRSATKWHLKTFRLNQSSE